MHLQCLLLNKNYHRCFPTLSLPASSVKMLKLGELLNIPSFTNKNEGSGNEYNKKPILVKRRPLTVRMRRVPNNQKFKKKIVPQGCFLNLKKFLFCSMAAAGSLSPLLCFTFWLCQRWWHSYWCPSQPSKLQTITVSFFFTLPLFVNEYK